MYILRNAMLESLRCKIYELLQIHSYDDDKLDHK